MIAVGAADATGTDDRTDDVVADFSQPGQREPAVPTCVAPGRRSVSLRVPGSYHRRTYPAPVTAAGSAQPASSAAAAPRRPPRWSPAPSRCCSSSGPSLTPDQVKRAAQPTADPIRNGDAVAAGAGRSTSRRAAGRGDRAAPTQLNLTATGLGSLEAARGGSHVYDAGTARARPASGTSSARPGTAAWSLASRRRRLDRRHLERLGVDRQRVRPAWHRGPAAMLDRGRSWTGRVAGPARSWAGRSWAADDLDGRILDRAALVGRSWTGGPWTDQQATTDRAAAAGTPGPVAASGPSTWRRGLLTGLRTRRCRRPCWPPPPCSCSVARSPASRCRGGGPVPGRRPGRLFVARRGLHCPRPGPPRRARDQSERVPDGARAAASSTRSR